MVQSWDTAVTAEPTSDFSVCTTWGFREGAWYLLDLYRGRLEYPALKRMVIELRDRWRADHVVIEDASSGIPLVQELRQDGYRNVFAYRPEQNKEVRVVAQTARLDAGRFLVPARAPWLEAFRRELQAFPNGRHDDQVDSLTLFLEWIHSRIGRAWHERAVHGGRRPRPRRRDGDTERPARARPRSRWQPPFNIRRYLDDMLRPGTRGPTVYHRDWYL